MIKVLMLCSKKYWDNKMSRVRFHSMEAIKNHPLIDGIFDGPGFEGWTNCVDSVNKHTPDVIFWYKPLGLEGYDKVDEHIPKILSYNEMYHVKDVKEEIIKSKTTYCICHLGNDIKLYDGFNYSTFYNIPHSVNIDVFKDYGLGKQYDILVTGVMSPKIYPVRWVLSKLVKSSELSGFKIRVLKHPGYSIKNVDAQVVEYAKEVSKAKVVLSCSSVYKYALAKHLEIPACGSLLIGDYPEERRDFFSKIMVDVGQYTNYSKVINTIKYWVTHNKEREELVSNANSLINQNYTQEHYANKFYDFLVNVVGITNLSDS